MNYLMPSSRNMARMAGLYAARTLGPACAQSASSGRFTWYSTPFSRMEQPPAARTLRDQSDWLPNVSLVVFTTGQVFSLAAATGRPTWPAGPGWHAAGTRLARSRSVGPSPLPRPAATGTSQRTSDQGSGDQRAARLSKNASMPSL